MNGLVKTVEAAALLILASALAALGAGIKVSDSAGAFLRFYDSAKSAAEQDQKTRFQDLVFAAAPEFYRYRFEDWKASGRDPEQELLSQIRNFSSYEGDFREVYRTVQEQLDSSMASFCRRFPDFSMDSEVWLVHSLGLADGTKRSIAGREVFVVGVDMIARYHPGDNTAFFHHELLHFYHGQHYRQSSALFSHLWTEGLAVYVSKALNPAATGKQLVLADDRGSLAEAVDPALGRIAAELLTDLQSQDWQVHNKYFAASSRNPAVPARAGYYIGLLLVTRLSAHYSLDRLVRLQDAELLPAITAELERMKL